MTTAAISVKEAKRLEDSFLGGLNEAQDAYEQIVEARAWTVLGYNTYAEWWQDRVVPLMRALSMRPTKEIAAAGIAQVREEEADLPPVQRRTQAEIGEMFGVSEQTVARSEGRSRGAPSGTRSDLEEDRPDGNPAEGPTPALDDGTEDTPESEAGTPPSVPAGGSLPPASGNGQAPDRGFAGDLAEAKTSARNGPVSLAQKSIEALKLAREIVRDRCNGVESILDDLRADPTGYEIAPLWVAELDETAAFIETWRKSLKSMQRERLRSVK